MLCLHKEIFLQQIICLPKQFIRCLCCYKDYTFPHTTTAPLCTFIIRMMPCSRPECELDRFTTDSPASAFSTSAAPRPSSTGRINNPVKQTRVLIIHNVAIYRATICSTFSQTVCRGKWHKSKFFFKFCTMTGMSPFFINVNRERLEYRKWVQLSCWHMGFSSWLGAFNSPSPPIQYLCENWWRP